MENANPNSPSTDSPAAETTAAKPVRKRSTFEMIVVWGGILILLALVFVEWNSKNQFETSLKNVEAAIAERDESGMFKGLKVEDVGKYVKGYAFHSDAEEEEKSEPARGEPTVRKQRILTYQWPSVFKTYKIKLAVDGKGLVISADAVIPGQ